MAERASFFGFERRSLEEFFEALRDVVGEDGVQKIQDEYGGTTVFVASDPPEGSWISRLFGHDEAKRIGAYFKCYDADGKMVGGVRVSLPLGFRGLRARAIAETDQLIFEGYSAAEIARRLGIHERTVWSRKARLRKEGKQVPKAATHAPYNHKRAEIERLLLLGQKGAVIARKLDINSRVVEYYKGRLRAEGKL